MTRDTKPKLIKKSDGALVVMTALLRTRSKFPDILEKEEKAEKQVNKCNSHVIDTMIEIDRLLEKNKEFKGMRDYDVLIEDADIIKRDFIKECICRRRAK